MYIYMESSLLPYLASSVFTFIFLVFSFLGEFFCCFVIVFNGVLSTFAINVIFIVMIFIYLQLLSLL